MATPLAVKTALIEALKDEYRARATYRKVIERFGDVRPFVNVLESEERHVRALERLCEKYAVRPPRDTWTVEAPATLLDACREGVDAEVENGAMYERLLGTTRGHPDVQRVLRRLQSASQEGHLPAFQRCVDRESRGDRPARRLATDFPGRGPLRRRRRRRGGEA